MQLSETSLEPKQQDAIDRLYNYDRSILVAATGDGKTAICLTAVQELIDKGVFKRVIVACPVKVRNVWYQEPKKWEHLEDLTVCILHGTPKQRIAILTGTSAQVLVVSLDSLEWLLKQPHGATGIIIDELSKASGKQAYKLKNKKESGCFIWRVGMTATPVSQDFLKLYRMCRIIDGGQALGRNKAKYEQTYFNSDYHGHTLTLREGADAIILNKVRGLVHVVADTKVDELPPLLYHTRRFDMPVATRDFYNEMKKTMIIEQDNIEAANAAVQSGKLRQLASGFLYPEYGSEAPVIYDYARLQAAGQWVTDLMDHRGVIFYEYVEQQKQLLSAYPTEFRTTSVEEFLMGGHPLLLAQFNSLSHGIEGLQHLCSNVLFYQPIWSRDAAEQAVGRVWRKGQDQEVHATALVCDDTLDDLVIERVEDRAKWMEMFVEHLRA